MGLVFSLSEIGAGGFQRGYHGLYRNQSWVIRHGVYLAEPSKTAAHLDHTFQPLQG